MVARLGDPYVVHHLYLGGHFHDRTLQVDLVVRLVGLLRRVGHPRFLLVVPPVHRVFFPLGAFRLYLGVYLPRVVHRLVDRLVVQGGPLGVLFLSQGYDWVCIVEGYTPAHISGVFRDQSNFAPDPFVVTPFQSQSGLCHADSSIVLHQLVESGCMMGCYNLPSVAGLGLMPGPEIGRAHV